ncbi:arf-GAP with Rho-GAP domain, ANK repeat and PH domain-containing protein 1 [Microplitis demolitor]|uniref:arf-GAP with Rho-GAP domain, ANK repeat and PH domain-containing protein 1 n=1 Tax=Microplitis demolitor TaxID=69319 RepID=UPI0004CD6D31|nr:arf-GAP with Rho-GAP domain, ANK repeat and PH domain-containing protein 1 [Microplitis demolitor]
MEVKPVPKPRSIIPERPVPAPRNIGLNKSVNQSTRSLSPSESSSQSEMSDDRRSTESRSSLTEKNLFKNLGSSSRQLKDEISEKMTVKGKAMISSTRNASIRLEKSVKNLLTRRLTSQEVEESKKNEDDVDRCVSMPACDDIFKSISFYSPLGSNLKSMKNEQDLTETRYSPPPPVYPPPPLPDESIYDELQSVTSGSRYGTMSSSVSDRLGDFPDAISLLTFAQNKSDSESNQSLNFSDVNSSSQSQDISKRLSRSDSWTFYDSADKSDKHETDGLETIASSAEEEEPIRERVTDSSNSAMSVRNSLYENWSLWKSDTDNESKSEPGCPRHNKSLLFEFDPFAKPEENTYGNYENNDMMLLEALLATSESPTSAGSITDLRERDEDTGEEDVEESTSPAPISSPPAPPRRYDSLPKNEYDEVELVEAPEKVVGKNPALLPKLVHLARRKQPAVPPRKSSVKVLDESVAEEPGAQNKFENNQVSKPAEERKKTMMQKLKQLRHDSTAHVRPNVMNFMKNTKLLRTRDQVKKVSSVTTMERPSSEAQIIPVCHRGIVYRSGVGIERAKDLVQRAAVLSDQKISFYVDKSMSTLKEVINLDAVLSVHLLQDVKTVDGETVHCIAVSCKGRPSVHVFYAKGITERRIWAQRILEALTPVFPAKYSAELTRAGWAYLKEGVTGSWFSAWVLLQQRTLIYTKSLDIVEFEQLDLRKARCILIREQEGPIEGAENIQIVVIDAGHGALHLAAPGTREASAWRHALHQAATSCGAGLDEQQLTQDDVPVILDKCINFIYAHGIMSEGIYRKGGSSSAVVRLLEAFRRDAWATQITRGSYSEHDVATVLRRFLRDLPEPLIPPSVHNDLCRASGVEDDEERAKKYREILMPVLNEVSTKTLRRILAHLHCLSQQSSRNLMTVENISAVWGPTLMHAGSKSADDWNRAETTVVGDLIRLYPKLYQLSADDLAKEAKILEVLERHVANNGLRGAPSGDLKIWIYLFTKDGECVNVTIGPQKSAADVCRELSEKAKVPAHELCLQECTLGGVLERPLHHAEKVLEAVARWGYWDPEDRKDNILILKKDRLYRDIVPRIKPPMTISGELKFADTKSKSFKTYLFEFSQAKLCCYKDKACAIKINEWKIEDMIWYLGHESKRNPQSGWSITFLLKNKKPTRCKDSPFFGNILAGASVVDQYRWLAAMLFGEHQLNLLPSAINLMDP